MIDTEPPPPVPSGPTVEPAIRTNMPDDVVQTSPFTGDVGALPCGRLIDAPPVVEARVVTKPEKVVLPENVLLPFNNGMVAPDVPIRAKDNRPPEPFRAFAKAVTTLEFTAGHAIVVLAEFSMRHGAVAPPIVVVPGTIEVADPPIAVQTPATQLIVLPSPSIRPNREFVAFWMAGEASDRMKVVATPLLAVGPPVAVGLAPPAPAAAEITPPEMVIVEPSGLTSPSWPVVAVCTAGAASDRM